MTHIVHEGDPVWTFPKHRWFNTAVMRYRDGGEARLAWLRLPSWGYGYDIAWDKERWGQRVLVYNGHRGFLMTWTFD